MTINEWWRGDSRERFWVEITNRDNYGTNLIAPKLNDAGREEWSYELVRYVRPGDIVLHWQKDAGPALVGYSHCSEGAFDSSLIWQSRGTYGRTHPATREEPAWEALLQGYRDLAQPVTLERIRELEANVRQVRADLEAIYSKPLYFPYALSELRPIRAAQAYVAKFPAALVDAISELRELGQAAVDEPDDSDAPRRARSAARGRSSGYGRQNDAAKRKAIERYAVDMVLDHYRALGYSAKDVGATEAWDVTVTHDGVERHIEVKGSTTDRLAIDVTEGEVRHAEDLDTLLIVIDRIKIDSKLTCSGGRWRHWPEWVPDRGELIPTAYRHPLPKNQISGRPTTF